MGLGFILKDSIRTLLLWMPCLVQIWRASSAHTLECACAAFESRAGFFAATWTRPCRTCYFGDRPCPSKWAASRAGIIIESALGVVESGARSPQPRQVLKAAETERAGLSLFGCCVQQSGTHKSCDKEQALWPDPFSESRADYRGQRRRRRASPKKGRAPPRVDGTQTKP